MNAMRARGGFTLVEMVVVMLILAVATAVAVPALLAPREDDDLTAATRRVELLFRLARDSAARAGVPLALSIDSATSAVWLVPERFTPEPAAATLAQGRTPRPPRMGARVAAALDGEPLGLPATVALEMGSARARFVFQPGGAAFGDSLVLRSGVHARLVTLDPWSGHAIVR